MLCSAIRGRDRGVLIEVVVVATHVQREHHQACTCLLSWSYGFALPAVSWDISELRIPTRSNVSRNTVRPHQQQPRFVHQSPIHHPTNQHPQNRTFGKILHVLERSGIHRAFVSLNERAFIDRNRS